MQAVILAAGQGVRLAPLTDTTPKPMIEIGGKPIIDHTLASLPDAVSEVFVVIGHLGEQIKKHLGDEFNGRSIKYIEQTELNGTGGAIKLLEHELEDKFLVLNGDDLYSKDDLELLRQLELGMLVSKTQGPASSSIETGPDGRITGIELNPGAKPILRNTGAYLLNQDFFSEPLVEITAHNHHELSLPHTMIELAKTHRVDTIKATFWMPVGTPEEINAAEVALKNL